MKGNAGALRAVALGSLTLLCLAPWVQTSGTPAEQGIISGIVKDQAGRAVPNAKVTLRAEQPEILAQKTTGRDGAYTFTGLKAGTYSIAVECEGFEKVAPLRVDSRQQTPVNFVLKPAAPAGLDAGLGLGGFYEGGAFKQSPLSSSGEAGGYSTGAQAEVSRGLLEKTAALESGSSPKTEETRKEIEALLQQGDSSRLHHLLGKEKAREGDFAAAAKEYEQAARTEPSEDNFFNWANALLVQKSYAAAEKAFASGVERHSQSARLRLGLGVARYQQGKYKEAVDTFIAASDLDPSDIRPYIFLGQAYGSATVSESPQVIERLRRFEQLHPKNALSHYYCAAALWKRERRERSASGLDEIESLLKRALDLDPKFAEAHAQLGVVCEERQKFPEAIGHYEQAVTLQPALAETHYRLAKLYSRTGQKARADEELAIYERLRK